MRYGTYPRNRRKQSRPRPGTATAKIYDYFIANEGEPVNLRELASLAGVEAKDVNIIIERINNAYDVYILNQGKGYYILLNEEELI